MLIGRFEIHVGRIAQLGCFAKPLRCETPLSIQTSIVSLRLVVPSGKPDCRGKIHIAQFEPNV